MKQTKNIQIPYNKTSKIHIINSIANAHLKRTFEPCKWILRDFSLSFTFSFKLCRIVRSIDFNTFTIAFSSVCIPNVLNKSNLSRKKNLHLNIYYHFFSSMNSLLNFDGPLNSCLNDVINDAARHAHTNKIMAFEFVRSFNSN